MTSSQGPWWLRWLPADSRAGVQRRAFIVWGMAAVIGVAQSLLSPYQHPLGMSLLYSYAISTCIWCLCDPLRIVLHRWLGAQPPYYWSFNARSIAYQVLAVVVGYAAGTALGDAYTGQSSWQLLQLSPQRFWGFVLGSFGISAGFLFFFYHREKAQALEQQATEARLKLLETQLEPHMLFNTLANLRVLIQVDPPRAVAMLDRLGDYLRATLKASRTDAVGGGHTLADEAARLRDYLELMAVRMGPRLGYALDLPDTLLQQPVPPLLLQPLVENAIRHGLEPQVEGGRITVTAQPDGPRQWRITVRDTGVGMDPQAPPPPRADGGFGLAQVRERMASLPGAGPVQVDSAPGQGTRITLTLPLQP